MILDTFAQRLTQALEMRNMTAAELSRRLGLNEGTISNYKKGVYEPKQRRLDGISKALDVSIPWLMGYDVPFSSRGSETDLEKQFDNIFPIELKKFPLLGEIACGEPIFCDEDRESYILAGSDIRADFCLKCKGDSMINARIYDGDIVFIRKQDIVDNGEIAAVVIEDEATLKRVYYDRDKNVVTLIAENPKYTPMIYSGSDLEQIHVLGKAIAFQSDVR